MRALFTRDLAYEREVFSALDQHVSTYDAIVEIGANVGFFSLYFASARRDASVPIYCFEPSAIAFDRLRANLRANDTRNVFAIPAAVSGSSGLIRFYEPEGHLTNGSTVESFASIFAADVKSTLVPCVSGDAVQRLIGNHQRSLIKIDVEGAESSVLGALRATIDANRPDVLLEVLPMFVDSLNDFAWPSGYRKYAITDAGLVEHPRFIANTSQRDYFVRFEASCPASAQQS